MDRQKKLIFEELSLYFGESSCYLCIVKQKQIEFMENSLHLDI